MIYIFLVEMSQQTEVTEKKKFHDTKKKNDNKKVKKAELFRLGQTIFSYKPIKFEVYYNQC